MKRIAVIGETLVEIMADVVGEGFGEPLALTGPVPVGRARDLRRSGGPGRAALLADRLGRGTMISDGSACAGWRWTGSTSRLSAWTPKGPRGTAFVRYREDGDRDFVFNIRHSAAGTILRSDDVDRTLGRADHLHVMGSSLSAPDVAALTLGAARTLKARGGTVSFDPNIRKEMLDAPGLTDAISTITRLSDLLLPSGRELGLLADTEDDALAVDRLLEGGAVVVHKNGRQGVRLHGRHRTVRQGPFPVEEVDPTGAGDCFAGVFVSLWLRDVDPAGGAAPRGRGGRARRVAARPHGGGRMAWTSSAHSRTGPCRGDGDSNPYAVAGGGF